MKKMLKKMVMAGAVLVMAGSLAACGSNKDAAGKDDGVKKVGVLLPGPTGYFVATKQGIDEAAKKNNIEIEYADAEWDASKQLSQAEDYFTKGVDAIMIAAVDSAAGEKIVDSANEAEVPVIAMTNGIGEKETGEFDGLLTYVGQNEVKTGKATGELAKQLLGDKPAKAILIEGVPGTTPQINRKKGLEEALKGSQIEIIYNQTSNWEKEEALKIVEDLIQKKQKFDIVICQDDNSATGAAQALQEAGMKDQVLVTGLGGSKDGLNAVKEGLLDGTTYMSAVEEGAEAVEAAAAHFKGDDVPKVTEIEQVPVNKDNVGEFKGEW